jgi:hypothetical protein
MMCEVTIYQNSDNIDVYSVTTKDESFFVSKLRSFRHSHNKRVILLSASEAMYEHTHTHTHTSFLSFIYSLILIVITPLFLSFSYILTLIIFRIRGDDRRIFLVSVGEGEKATDYEIYVWDIQVSTATEPQFYCEWNTTTNAVRFLFFEMTKNNLFIQSIDSLFSKHTHSLTHTLSLETHCSSYCISNY